MPTVLNGDATESHYNHSSVQRALDTLGLEYFSKLALESPTNGYKLDRIECLMDSVYLVGRYNKFSRIISQTPWFIDGEKKALWSVEELITDFVIKAIPAQSKLPVNKCLLCLSIFLSFD